MQGWAPYRVDCRAWGHCTVRALGREVGGSGGALTKERGLPHDTTSSFLKLENYTERLMWFTGSLREQPCGLSKQSAPTD